jgi:hypothetical protein
VSRKTAGAYAAPYPSGLTTLLSVETCRYRSRQRATRQLSPCISARARPAASATIRPLAAAVPVSIGRSVAFSAAPRARTFRSMCGKSPQADDVLAALLECLLECPLEILHVVRSPYLLRHRNKAVMALAIRDFRPG